MNNKKYISSISFKTFTGILAFTVSLALFSIIAHEVVIEKEDWFDSKIFVFFNAYSSPLFIKIFNFITFFGSGDFLLPAYIILILLLLYKHRKVDAMHVGILGITSTLLMFSLKLFFARHRPEFPLLTKLDSYSFPSGHSMGAFVFFSIIAWELWQSRISTEWKWGLITFFFLLSLAVSISRIVLRYHYASDVIAGSSLGLSYVLLYFWLQKKWR